VQGQKCQLGGYKRNVGLEEKCFTFTTAIGPVMAGG
jgi:hypothetical protein